MTRKNYTKVTKFQSFNLFGETRKEELSRLRRARFNALLSGKSRNVSLGEGTSLEQKRLRRNSLRKYGLSTRIPKYNEKYF